MGNVYFKDGFIYYYGEVIDIKSIPDILGKNDYLKYRNYVKQRLKGIDIRKNKF